MSSPMYQRAGKRIGDVAVATLSLGAAAPAMAAIAALIKIDSPGPVIFRQTRTGKDGKTFELLKYRTMTSRNDFYDQTRADEVTRVGKVLRRYSLDELPQLVNVLRGEMSLIGPRPWLTDYYENMNEHQRGRYSVRPGITGLAQARGRNGLSIFQKIDADLEYVQNVSLRNDLAIIAMTLLTAFDKVNLDIGKEGIRAEIEALAEQLANFDTEETDERGGTMTGSGKQRVAVFGVTVDHAVRYHADLARMLAADGWEVHFISSGGPLLDELKAAVEVHEIPMRRDPAPFPDLVSLVKWLRVMAMTRPDVVVAGTPKASLLGMLASTVFGVPHRIYWVHGLRLETTAGLKRSILKAFEKVTAALATDLIAVSPSLQRKLVEMQIAPEAKVHVLGQGSTQGVDLGVFRARNEATLELAREMGLDEALPTIAFIGRLTRDKGIADLEVAFAELKAREHNFQVLLVGPAEDELGQQFETAVRKLGVRVISVGQVSDASPYYPVADIFCLPSYREGLPNSVLESFAAEVPVVATRVTGNSDVIEDGKTGLLVEPNSPTELADALERFLDDREYADTVAANAKEYVRQVFDSEVVVRTQFDFLTSLDDE